MLNGILALVVAYLLGSIPSAYIITNMQTGQDIRQIGGGNVGTLNVYLNVGPGAGILVLVMDIAKGAAAVAFPLLIGAPLIFTLGCGLAVIAGHIWPVFLKFKGGNGLATALGVLGVLATRDLFIAIALAVGIMVFTRNPILSLNLGLLSVPFTTWLLEGSPTMAIFTLLMGLLMIAHFLPIARAALLKAGSKENLLAELIRADKPGKAG